MRLFKRILLGLPIVLLLAAAGFTAWAYTPLGPMPEAIAALQSDAVVQVTTSPWLTFTPVGRQPTTGFIFYPGGRVDARSYAPAARAIAGQGYLVVIVPMPFNLAVTNPGAAAAVIRAHPEIRQWAVGGHSLGGAMAANFAYAHPEAVQGLVLWAAYPAGNNSLAGRQLSVVSISATNDGLATPEKIAASRQLLPADARFVAIAGGNHAGFGWYGPQGGDGQAVISRAEQQAQVIAATVELLASLSRR
jgi:predicted alpha/beta-hydrolase family hydrolase